MNLAKMYMKRVTLELKSVGNSDRESCQESLLLQGVNFAYRAHKVILKLAVFYLSFEKALNLSKCLIWCYDGSIKKLFALRKYQ